MRQSDELHELYAALAIAQGEIEDATKDSQNPHFKSRYADLSSVRAATRGPAAKHGLATIQLVRTGDHVVEVETILSHKSGQFIAETLRMPVQQWAPQPIGSAMTYARRYGWMGIWGIAPSEDDDGEAAMGRGGNGKPKNDGPISDEEYKTLQRIIAERGVSVDKVIAYYKVESLADLPASKYLHCHASIMAAKSAKNGGANGHDGAQANG
jgi:hypothetical protein